MGWLSPRTATITIGILCTPPLFIAFDVLQRGSRDLRRLPLAERRTVRLPDDGVKAWAIVEERGHEGMVAKDPRSRYCAGRRMSSNWSERRRHRRRSPFVDLRSLRGAVWLEPRLRAEVSYAEVAAGRLGASSRRGLVTR